MFTTHSQFYKPAATEQKANEVVNITDWSIGELSIYREGARDKSLLTSPEQTPYSFLISGHKYLLKRTYSVKKTGSVLYEQFWNEIIAYKLGRVLGIKVPPAFVAYYGREGQNPYYGSLIEWFYAYGGKDEVKRGGEVIIKYIQGYDTTKGELHNFQSLVDIFTKEQVEGWLPDLTQMLLLDAIIGNTDRHQDNWQIIDYSEEKQRLLSPAFDNGTSLGYSIRYEQLDSWLSGDWQNKQAKLVRKGYHHMKWQVDDKEQASHFGLLEKMAAQIPECIPVIKGVLQRDVSLVFDEIRSLCRFEIVDEKYLLSDKRADFIIKMIEYRFNYAKNLFGT